jgi:hypothetical protein
MEHTFTHNITCENSEKCSDIIVDKLEKKFNCCLKSVNDVDSIHGGVVIIHGSPHQITVIFYEDIKNLKSSVKHRLKKLEHIPPAHEIQSTIM